jgi:hypothetical protein
MGILWNQALFNSTFCKKKGVKAAILSKNNSQHNNNRLGFKDGR